MIDFKTNLSLSGFLTEMIMGKNQDVLPLQNGLSGSSKTGFEEVFKGISESKSSQSGSSNSKQSEYTLKREADNNVTKEKTVEKEKKSDDKKSLENNKNEDKKVIEKDNKSLKETSDKENTLDKKEVESDMDKDLEDKDKISNQENLTPLINIIAQSLNLKVEDIKNIMQDSEKEIESLIAKNDIKGLNSLIEKLFGKDISELKEVRKILKDFTKEFENLEKLNSGDEWKIPEEKLRNRERVFENLNQNARELKDKLNVDENNEATNEKAIDLNNPAKESLRDKKNIDTLENENVNLDELQKTDKVILPIKDRVEVDNKMNITAQVIKSENSGDLGTKVNEVKSVDAINNNTTNEKSIFQNITNKTSQVNKAFKEELINQIVDKAKLTVTNNKKEMTLDLKPEHLGKISLKVASENGAIMAKIIADNEQVKSTLENNLSMLKEQLENSGIKVQGFSISLRNDQQNQSSKKDSGEDSKSSEKTRNRAINTRIDVNDKLLSTNEIRNKYYLEEESNINLTA